MTARRGQTHSNTDKCRQTYRHAKFPNSGVVMAINDALPLEASCSDGVVSGKAT